MKENKIIAEFMYVGDFEHPKIDGSLPWGDYHKSWDWLMPVIEKCLVGEAEQSEEVSNTAIKNIYESICNQDIAHAYNSVVGFINNYNKNK